MDKYCRLLSLDATDMCVDWNAAKRSLNIGLLLPDRDYGMADYFLSRSTRSNCSTKHKMTMGKKTRFR